MIRNAFIIVITTLLSGCHVLPWSTQRQAAVGPPLPMSVSCEELVDHLNQQSNNLKSWRSNNVRLTARMPGAAFMPAMKGNIACESPNRFHLTARNFAAFADMGANSERCWFQSTPGHDGVISWRHEDAHLLHDFQSQIPYIDPDWLMLVLGVKQLNADDYVLEPGNNPQANELWLTSIQSAPNSDVYRYVIKVSTKQRVVREHAAYDQDHRLIVRATLSDHQWFDGHLLPKTVRIELPTNDAELKLSFAKIETDPVIDSSMWGVPSVPNGDNMDLGQLIRAQRNARAEHHWNAEPPRRGATLGTPQFGTPQFDTPPQNAQRFDTAPLQSPIQQIGGTRQSVEVTPDWSVDGTPAEPEMSFAADAESPFNRSHRDPPRRRRFLGVFPVLW